MKQTEQQLAERLKRSDTAALESAMDGFSGYVCAVIRNFSRGALSEQDIDELCADVFYSLWTHRENLNAENGIRAYLSAIAANAVKNRFRTLKPPCEDISELELADDFSVERAAEQSEMMSELRKALETLPELDQEVFVRFYFYGESSSDIAIKTGITEGSVCTKLSRTRMKLREYLMKRGFDHV